MPRKSWINIELRPAEAPSVVRCEPTDSGPYYDVEFERFGVAIMLSPDELQELVSRALVAQSGAVPQTA